VRILVRIEEMRGVVRREGPGILRVRMRRM
jgi:hypothetical protein